MSEQCSGAAYQIEIMLATCHALDAIYQSGLLYVLCVVTKVPLDQFFFRGLRSHHPPKKHKRTNKNIF